MRKPKYHLFLIMMDKNLTESIMTRRGFKDALRVTIPVQHFNNTANGVVADDLNSDNYEDLFYSAGGWSGYEGSDAMKSSGLGSDIYNYSTAHPINSTLVSGRRRSSGDIHLKRGSMVCKSAHAMSGFWPSNSRSKTTSSHQSSFPRRRSSVHSFSGRRSSVSVGKKSLSTLFKIMDKLYLELLE